MTVSPPPPPPPPEPTWRAKLRRSIAPDTWLAVTRTVVILCVLTVVVTGVLFVITAAEAKPSVAVEVMLGISAPYGDDLNGWAVALAIAGWIIVPVLIGAIASLVIEERLRHQRYPLAQALERLAKEVEELKLAEQRRRRDAGDQ